MGRLHTCYSPVRRSPAGKAEASPPLPLDLHVLSLSLAFILSQDQTLRCCLSCLIFLQKKNSGKTFINHVLPKTDILPSLGVLKSLFRPGLGLTYWISELTRVLSFSIALVLLLFFHVYCNSFNVLSVDASRVSPKNFAKLSKVFQPTKL